MSVRDYSAIRNDVARVYKAMVDATGRPEARLSDDDAWNVVGSCGDVRRAVASAADYSACAEFVDGCSTLDGRITFEIVLRDALRETP